MQQGHDGRFIVRSDDHAAIPQPHDVPAELLDGVSVLSQSLDWKTWALTILLFESLTTKILATISALDSISSLRTPPLFVTMN